MASRRRTLRLVGALAAAITAVATTIVAITLTAGPAAAAGTGTGYLRTNGRNIVDSTGAVVRLTGINWFGMETDNHTFHGLWANAPATWRGQIDRMASLGFNTIRVPYTGDSLRPGAQATSINSFTNPDLVGLSPLQILDLVINYAGSKGMRIILDRHRPTAAGQTPLWYTPQVTEASMIADWQMLAQRYAGNTTVIGADLFNEPHANNVDPQGNGACWGTGNTTCDWRLAAQRIGNAILQTNSNWLIFVEGVSCLPGPGTPNTFDNIPDDPMACDWWGGNLAGAATAPVQLSVANRLVYSPHDYAISVFDRQPWFRDANFPNNLPAVWDHFWGYLAKQNIAPVMLGEFGSTLANPLDVQWLNTLMNYLTTNGMSFTYWSWNPNSGDTGGIALDDWFTVNQQKMNILSPHLVPPVGGGSTTGPPPTTPSNQPPGTPGTLSASGTTTTSTTLSWGASSGTVTNYQIERCTGASCTNFTQIATSTATSFTNNGLTINTTYRYRVRATNSAGNSPYSNIVNVTTTNPTTVPGTPGNPTTSNATASSLTVSWGASTGTVANYQLERCAGATCTNFVNIANPTATTFNDSGLAAATTFRYRVRATNSAGNSAYSGIVNGTTLSGGGTGGCSATLTVQTQWQNGYVMQPVTVTNTGTATINGWTVTFTLPAGHAITNSWNATVTISGQTVTARGISGQNATLGGGANTNWGFQATRPNGNTALPSGATCTSP